VSSIKDVRSEWEGVGSIRTVWSGAWRGKRHQQDLFKVCNFLLININYFHPGPSIDLLMQSGRIFVQPVLTSAIVATTVSFVDCSCMALRRDTQGQDATQDVWCHVRLINITTATTGPPSRVCQYGKRSVKRQQEKCLVKPNCWLNVNKTIGLRAEIRGGRRPTALGNFIPAVLIKHK